jgi:hypothetical protein
MINRRTLRSGGLEKVWTLHSALRNSPILRLEQSALVQWLLEHWLLDGLFQKENQDENHKISQL